MSNLDKLAEQATPSLGNFLFVTKEVGVDFEKELISRLPQLLGL